MHQYLWPCSAPAFSFLIHQLYKSFLHCHVFCGRPSTTLFWYQSGYFFFASAKLKFVFDLYAKLFTWYSSGINLFKYSTVTFSPVLNARQRPPFFVMLPTTLNPWNKLSYCTWSCSDDDPCVHACQVNLRFNTSSCLTIFLNSGTGFSNTKYKCNPVPDEMI